MRLLVLLALVGCKRTGGLAPVATAEPVGEEAPAATSWAVGHWKGALAIPGGSLAMVLHVTEGPDGLQATMDSPDQGGFGIPVQTVTVDGDALTLDVTAVKGRFEGTRDGDTLSGTWSQGPASLSATFERSKDAGGPPKRPQDPKPPFPYVVEDVTVPSADDVVLAGTYTRPQGDGPFPGVILISGSGPQDRDEALMGHRPFAVLADHLTRAGIAVLRTDDRGVGASTGDFDSALTPDFAVDASHALAWLHARPETGAVGMIGHSEGGSVAPLAQVRPKDALPRAGFLVLLAGPGVGGDEVLIEQGALIAAAGGASAEDVSNGRAQMRVAIRAAVEGLNRTSFGAAVRAAPGALEAEESDLDALYAQLTDPWFRWFLAYDPEPTLKAVDVPVLALFGEKDLQVPPAQSAEPMRVALGANGTVEVLPGLNHLFQPATTGAPSEYATIETTMDPAALDRIASWILEVAAR